MNETEKTITILYFALFREAAGMSQETISTQARTPRDLFKELHRKFNLPVTRDGVRVAINDEFKTWETELISGDTVGYIPPVAGG